jgi:hypothetical protein
MARAKAKFNRPPDLVDLPEPSAPEPDIDALRQALRRFHPAHADDSQNDEVFGHPACAFAEALLNEAHWAWSCKKWNDESLRKDEIDAECNALKTKLQAASSSLRKYPGKTRSSERLATLSKTLRHVSRDVDLLLGIDTDVRDCADAIDQSVIGNLQPSVCADAIDELLVAIDDAKQRVSRASRKKWSTPFIAEELALRVIRVFEEECLPTATTTIGTGLAKKTSPLVSCLKALGDHGGIALSEKTWSEHAIAALKHGARLRPKDRPAVKQVTNTKPDDHAVADALDAVLAWGLRKK